MDRNEGNDSQTRPWYKRPWIIVVGFVGCSICLGSVVDDPTTSEVKQTLEDLESYGRVGFDLEETHISQARRRIQTMGWRWSGQDEVAWRQSLQYATNASTVVGAIFYTLEYDSEKIRDYCDDFL